MPTGTHQPQRVRGVDRLPPLIHFGLVGCLSLGCAGGDTATSQEGKPEAGGRSRVNAVQAKKAPKLDPNEFCTVYAEPDAAKPLTWPPLTGDAPASSKTKRWINVWATWCRPCVEELPRLERWKATIGRRASYDLVFLSADGAPEEVAAFAGKHPEVKDSLEIADAEALSPWLSVLGVEAGSLPVHLFVDEQDRVRCIRQSGIQDDDEEAVTQLLESL